MQYINRLLTSLSRSLIPAYALLACILMLQAPAVLAEKRLELYQLEQLVLDQSPLLRQQATAKGLAEVLVKVSGSQQTLSHPLVKEALAKSTGYLTRYSYSNSDQTITIAGDSRAAVLLSLQYSKVAIRRLFQAAQLPLWPENRPELLLWLASSSQQALGAQSSVINQLQVAGKQRGLPLVMPAFDLQDRQNLPTARLWALDEATILQASERYGADAVVAGRLSQTSPNLWKASIVLLHKGQSQYINTQAQSPNQVAQQLVDRLTAYFVASDAIVVTDEASAPSLVIAVDGINDFAQYADLIKHLDSQPLVAATTVVSVDGDQLRVELSYNGSEDKLLDALSDSSLLIAKAAPSVPVTIAPINPNSEPQSPAVAADPQAAPAPITPVSPAVSAQPSLPSAAAYFDWRGRLE